MVNFTLFTLPGSQKAYLSRYKTFKDGEELHTEVEV